MKHLATIGLLAAVLAFAVFGRRAAPPKVEYRVSGYFPRGFPLHGEVKLLSAPVVEMGRKEKVAIQYTVGDIAIEPGMAVEVWKHFTSDTEEFLPRVTFSRAGVEGETQRFSDLVHAATRMCSPTGAAPGSRSRRASWRRVTASRSIWVRSGCSTTRRICSTCVW